MTVWSLLAVFVSRYLHQQWDKKASVKKRTGEATGGEGGEASKKPRLEALPDTSNTQAGASGSVRAPSFSHGPGNSSQGSGPPPAYPGTSHQDNRFANQQ